MTNHTVVVHCRKLSYKNQKQRHICLTEHASTRHISFMTECRGVNSWNKNAITGRFQTCAVQEKQILTLMITWSISSLAGFEPTQTDLDSVTSTAWLRIVRSIFKENIQKWIRKASPPFSVTHDVFPQLNRWIKYRLQYSTFKSKRRATWWWKGLKHSAPRPYTWANSGQMALLNLCLESQPLQMRISSSLPRSLGSNLKVWCVICSSSSTKSRPLERFKLLLCLSFRVCIKTLVIYWTLHQG